MAAVPYPYLGSRSSARRPGARVQSAHLRLISSEGAFVDDAALADERAARRRVRIAAHRRMVARRRRIAAVLGATALVVGAWFGLGAIRGAGAATTAHLAGAKLVKGGQLYVARPGDTLWSIALRLQPTGDPRPIVDALEAEIHGRPLTPGMHLVLPR